jgi:hypothetical protein
MKKKFIYTSLICLLMGFSAAAQGNLQFNRIITDQKTLTSTFGGYTDLLTVPSGKVWKIESMSTGITSAGERIFELNGVLTIVSEGFSPIWLKAGDTARILFTASSDYNPDKPWLRGVYMSIIEYNIIP